VDERILVPLDGSKVGEAALPYVEELVSKLSPEIKVEVTLFQVVSSVTHYVVAGEAAAQIPYTEKEMERIKRKATDYLDKAGEGLRSRGAIVKIKVGIGRAAEEIIKAADEINADLISMSTHGRSLIRRWALGSVTDRVLRGGHKPVLLVRTSKEPAQT
jgi:nucleotide-binding universal stress UspA family protein